MIVVPHGTLRGVLPGSAGAFVPVYFVRSPGSSRTFGRTQAELGAEPLTTRAEGTTHGLRVLAPGERQARHIAGRELSPPVLVGPLLHDFPNFHGLSLGG